MINKQNKKEKNCCCSYIHLLSKRSQGWRIFNVSAKTILTLAARYANYFCPSVEYNDSSPKLTSTLLRERTIKLLTIVKTSFLLEGASLLQNFKHIFWASKSITSRTLDCYHPHQMDCYWRVLLSNFEFPQLLITITPAFTEMSI